MLHQRHRASSAIEGFNAALRPYLYVHKGATQGFLDLFRAWFNLRTRRWVRIPVKVISDSGLNVISESGQSGHRSERSDAGVGL